MSAEQEPRDGDVLKIRLERPSDPTYFKEFNIAIGPAVRGRQNTGRLQADDVRWLLRWVERRIRDKRKRGNQPVPVTFLLAVAAFKDEHSIRQVMEEFEINDERLARDYVRRGRQLLAPWRGQ